MILYSDENDFVAIDVYRARSRRVLTSSEDPGATLSMVRMVKSSCVDKKGVVSPTECVCCTSLYRRLNLETSFEHGGSAKDYGHRFVSILYTDTCMNVKTS